jgi:uncharacterized protein (TIGR02145 family)
MKKTNRIWITVLAITVFLLILPGSCKKSDDASSAVTDKDGHVYKTVKIGTQEWMAENLRTTKYLNGDLIGTTNPASLDISAESNPKYQWPAGGVESNAGTYGRLYTWYAVTDSRNICPAGWHVPTDAEWTILTTYLGGEFVAGGKLKETGTTHWQNPNTGATNESGFTALPGGDREIGGGFYVIGSIGLWCSATEFNTDDAWYRGLDFLTFNVQSFSKNKKTGFSVRCIKGS